MKKGKYLAVSVSSTTSCRARLIVSQLLFDSCKVHDKSLNLLANKVETDMNGKK